MSESVFSAVRRAYERDPDQVMMHDVGGPSDRSYSRQDIQQAIDAVRRRIALLSLPVGSRVGLVSENRHEWLVTYFAVVSLGHAVVPLDYRQTPSDWRRLLQHSGAEAIFLSDRLFSQLGDWKGYFSDLKLRVIFDQHGTPEEEGWESFSRIVSEYPHNGPPSEPHEVSPDDLASVVYTSGTTGNPKGVMLTHGNLMSNAKALTSWGVKRGVYASILPLNHTFGFTTTLAMILKGMSVILYSQIRQDILFESFERLHPTCLVGVPAFLERLAHSVEDGIAQNSPRLGRLMERFLHTQLGDEPACLKPIKKMLFKKIHDRFGGRLEYIVIGGAPLDPAMIRLFHLMGLPVLEGYGLTETSPVIAANVSGVSKVGSVGKPLQEAELRIDRPNADGVGEIIVRGPMVMKGYFRNPEETAHVLSQDGWFRTGDLGHIDEDGFLHVSGRIKDLIVTPNGKKVVPEDLEHVLGQVPLIAEVAAFGLPKSEGDVRGELVHVEIVPNREEASRQGIKDFYTAIRKDVAKMADTLPEFMRPRSVGFSEEPFPRTSTMKIRKFEVRQRVLEKRKTAPATKAAERARETDPLLHGDVGVLVIRVLKKMNHNIHAIFSNSHFTFDLGLESLTMIEFWATIERIFSIHVPEEKINELRDVGSVVRYLESLPDVACRVRLASREVAHEGRALGSWHEILDANADASVKVVESVLSDCRRSRPAFLKVFRRFFGLCSRLSVRGLENLPSHGPYILAPNHECYLDNLFVACVMPLGVREQMAVIGAKEFFDKPFTRAIARLCRTIPVDRKQVSSSVLQVGAQVLKKGKVLLIHPEGTRSPDGRLLPFKRGAAILANYAQCPLIPVYIEGAHEFWPKGEKLPRSRGRITITVGRPLRPLPVLQIKTMDEQKRAQELTDRLTKPMLALSEGRISDPPILPQVLHEIAAAEVDSDAFDNAKPREKFKTIQDITQRHESHRRHI